MSVPVTAAIRRTATNQRLVIAALLGLPRSLRRCAIVIVQLLLATLSNYLAFSLRFDGDIPAGLVRLFVRTLPWLILARASGFLLFRLEQGIWRYVGLWDLRRIALAVATSTLLFTAFVRWGYGTINYPRSIFLIDSALLLIFVGAFRLSPRVVREMGRAKGRRRLLIVGAGDTGERMLRQLRDDPTVVASAIGFVDDDPAKIGRRMHGVPVLGAVRDLPCLVERKTPDEVMVAIPGAEPALIRRIVKALEPFSVPITTVVRRRGIAVNGKPGFGEVRSLSVEDLLSRPAIGLDADRLRRLVSGKRVLVTGAGGSIGGELSRQIVALHPQSLVLFERHENGLYLIASALEDDDNGRSVHSVVGDVTDRGRLEAVFAEHRPDLVFHAAAHKHVPLMELNPCEAVKNNVGGTRLLVDAAMRYGVERFILISSDKAVNPSSVMGATKRVAELIVQTLGRRGSTRFVTVRFGNVLGSNGSVSLRFEDQVRVGGPVTVTDPLMTRYFMLIPEAVQLVLHAAAVGGDGETLALDMGDQIPVLDLARNVIRLSGLIPDKDVPIVFTGLRPGEKLNEELAGEGERLGPGGADKILRVVAAAPISLTGLEYELGELERRAAEDDGDGVILQLGRLVPTFRSSGRPTALLSA